MNPAIETIREATLGTPYEGKLFLVGGVVRDEVMGRPTPEDIDIVLEGDALELARFLHEKGIARHRPVTYPRFGTAMVQVDGHTVELVSARRESYLPESRKPDVELATLQDDVLRRDFTINTLMQNLHTGEILDLTGHGLADIEAGIIRTPLDPETTFYDDPLRMLRAIRFAVRFGFEIDPTTYEAIVRDAERLNIISKERIRDEFVKILMSDDASRGLRMLRDARLLAQFVPELLTMHGVTQDGGHVYDVWEHTLHALEALPPDADLSLRLAVLFHDVAKPLTKTLDTEGHSHFYGHDTQGAEIARRVLHRLRFPGAIIDKVTDLVSMHMRVAEYSDQWSDSAVKRLMRDAGLELQDLIALAEADRLGANPNASLASLRDLEQRVDVILQRIPLEAFQSPLDGREIMELLHIPPGTRVGEVKDFLMEEILEGRIPPQDKDAARKLILERFGGNSHA